MVFLGYVFERLVTTDPAEPYWSNTCHGNRHHRLFSLEKVVSQDGLVAFSLSCGRYQLRWAKLGQTPISTGETHE